MIKHITRGKDRVNILKVKGDHPMITALMGITITGINEIGKKSAKNLRIIFALANDLIPKRSMPLRLFTYVGRGDILREKNDPNDPSVFRDLHPFSTVFANHPRAAGIFFHTALGGNIYTIEIIHIHTEINPNNLRFPFYSTKTVIMG